MGSKRVRDDDWYGEGLCSKDSESMEASAADGYESDFIDDNSEHVSKEKGKSISMSDDEEEDDETSYKTSSDSDDDEEDNRLSKLRGEDAMYKEMVADITQHVKKSIPDTFVKMTHHGRDFLAPEVTALGFGPPPKRKRRKRCHGNDGHASFEELEWQKWEKEELDTSKGEEKKEEEKKPQVLMEKYETPEELVHPLLPFQTEFLAWSLKQELSNYRGGILADEMGMGKTVQAISLILAGRAEQHGHDEPGIKAAVEAAKEESNEPTDKVNATLVICPVVAIEQWRSEIERFTEEKSLKVLTYHGPGRKNLDLEELSKYDVVLSTYSIVELDHRKCLPDKLRCQYCRKAFTSKGLKRHLKFHCGPFAVKTPAQAKQSKKGKEMPAKRKSPISKDDLEKECKAAEKVAVSGTSLLHSLKWTRIILDEAHTIKERNSSTAKSVFALHSCYRWLLSGTPLQNRVGELYSLIRFLRVFPYSFYFCTKCNCKRLDFMDDKCEKCEHSSRNHFCWWNKYVANPIAKVGTTNTCALTLLRCKILDQLLLRRTKAERAADLAIPPKTLIVRKDKFDSEEEKFYEAVYLESKSEFNSYVEQGTVLNNYAHIFDLLTRLRQAVDHPYLLTKSKDALPFCGLCNDECDDPIRAQCGDSFCHSCIEKSREGAMCPRCDQLLKANLNPQPKDLSGYKKSSILHRLDLSYFQTSTKLEALKQEIHLMLMKDPSAKALVFSQFTSMLDLIGYSLKQDGMKTARLDGSMGLSHRVNMINMFRNEPDCRIFLMSLKAGGVALNLTVASQIFMMDPWWNPAVEHQAQDRIHRIGQYKPIRVTRFVIENSVEERILKLQEKKQLVFDGTIGGSQDALGKLSEKDLRFLFQ